MASRTYPKLPTAPEYSDEQSNFNAHTINSELDELVRLRNNFGKKYERYKKILNRLALVNAGSTALTVGSGIGSIATGATLIGIPISAGLGGMALTGSFCSGVTSTLIKRYQKKFVKVMKLTGITLSAIAVFERGISKSLEDRVIDYKEFEILQAAYYEALDKISSTDKKIEVEARNQFEKGLMEELKNIKRRLMPAVEN